MTVRKQRAGRMVVLVIRKGTTIYGRDGVTMAARKDFTALGLPTGSAPRLTDAYSIKLFDRGINKLWYVLKKDVEEREQETGASNPPTELH